MAVGTSDDAEVGDASGQGASERGKVRYLKTRGARPVDWALVGALRRSGAAA